MGTNTSKTSTTKPTNSSEDIDEKKVEQPRSSKPKKIILWGSSGGNKSRHALELSGDNDSAARAVGIDFFTATLNNQKYQIWDTAGQERFRTIGSNYTRSADCILLCPTAPNQIAEIFSEVEKAEELRHSCISCFVVIDEDFFKTTAEQEALIDEAQAFGLNIIDAPTSDNRETILNIIDRDIKLTSDARLTQRNENIVLSREDRNLRNAKIDEATPDLFPDLKNIVKGYDKKR